MILEHIFSEYDVYIGQEEMLFANFTGMGEIYKIHGSANKPDSIIITERDYQDFEKRSAYLIAKLLTMFLEYPVIFMGYSLQDKNIRNILKTISDCLSQEKIQLLKNRVVFVSYEEDNKVSERAITFENGNTITMQQISTTDFSLIYKAILSIKSRYSPRVLRDLRKDIYQLANTEHTKGVVYATGIENLDKIEEGQQFILGVGIQKNGRIIKAEQIYTDIVLDNQYFDPSKSFCLMRLHQILFFDQHLPIQPFLNLFGRIDMVLSCVPKCRSLFVYSNEHHIWQYPPSQKQLQPYNILRDKLRLEKSFLSKTHSPWHFHKGFCTHLLRLKVQLFPTYCILDLDSNW